MKKGEKAIVIALMTLIAVGVVLIFLLGLSRLVRTDIYHTGFWVFSIYVADRVYERVKKQVEEDPDFN